MSEISEKAEERKKGEVSISDLQRQEEEGARRNRTFRPEGELEHFASCAINAHCQILLVTQVNNLLTGGKADIEVYPVKPRRDTLEEVKYQWDGNYDTLDPKEHASKYFSIVGLPNDDILQLFETNDKLRDDPNAMIVIIMKGNRERRGMYAPFGSIPMNGHVCIRKRDYLNYKQLFIGKGPRHQAIGLTGPYGIGKSVFLNVLLFLLLRGGFVVRLDRWPPHEEVRKYQVDPHRPEGKRVFVPNEVDEHYVHVVLQDPDYADVPLIPSRCTTIMSSTPSSLPFMRSLNPLYASTTVTQFTFSPPIPAEIVYITQTMYILSTDTILDVVNRYVCSPRLATLAAEYGNIGTFHDAMSRSYARARNEMML